MRCSRPSLSPPHVIRYGNIEVRLLFLPMIRGPSEVEFWRGILRCHDSLGRGTVKIIPTKSEKLWEDYLLYKSFLTLVLTESQCPAFAMSSILADQPILDALDFNFHPNPCP